MKQWTLAPILAVFLTTFLSACSGDKKPDESQNLQSQSANSTSKNSSNLPSADKGKIIFMNECAACHGKDGKRSMPGMKKDAANLASPTVQKKTDEELKKIIRKGKKENPEMAGHSWLTDSEMESLIMYLRTLK